MIKNVDIRPATQNEIAEFYPSGSPRSAYVWAIIYKGSFVAIAGVTVEPGGAVAFCDAKTGINAPKMAIWRTSQEVYRRMRQLGLPMITAPDPCIKGSRDFLVRLGFAPRQGVETLSG